MIDKGSVIGVRTLATKDVLTESIMMNKRNKIKKKIEGAAILYTQKGSVMKGVINDLFGNVWTVGKSDVPICSCEGIAVAVLSR